MEPWLCKYFLSPWSTRARKPWACSLSTQTCRLFLQGWEQSALCDVAVYGWCASKNIFSELYKKKGWCWDSRCTLYFESCEWWEFQIIRHYNAVINRLPCVFVCPMCLHLWPVGLQPGRAPGQPDLQPPDSHRRGCRTAPCGSAAPGPSTWTQHGKVSSRWAWI